MPKTTVAAPRQLMAFKGDVITCEKGHKLYRLGRNMLPGDPLKADILKRLTTKAQKPKDGDPIAKECHCGAPWMRQPEPGKRPAQLHFADGEWRP